MMGNAFGVSDVAKKQIPWTAHREDPWLHAALVLAILLTIALFSRTPFLGNHYLLVLFPLYFPALALLINKSASTQKFSTLCATILFCGMGMVLEVKIFGNGGYWDAVLNLRAPFTENTAADTPLQSHHSRKHTSHTRQKLAAVRAATPQDARSVIVLGSNCNLYFATEARIASRHLYQWPLVELSPAIATKFQRELRQHPPELLYLAWPYVRATPRLELDTARFTKNLPEVPALLSREYELLHVESGLALLYRRKAREK